MTMDPYGQWIGTPMGDREVDRLLETTGWGVLSLADGDEPYSIPVSFGYDGEAVLFVLIRESSTNRKFEFIADGKTARLLVTAVGGRFDWRSVAVTGPVRAVDPNGEEWEAFLDALDRTAAWFSSDFERAGGVEELRGWRLEPAELRGLEVRGDED
jgi:hypothetical protein